MSKKANTAESKINANSIDDLRPCEDERLEILCQELLRARPNQEKVRQLMTDAKIQYTSDPIQQLTSVLQLMDKTKYKTNKNTDRAVDL